MGTITKRIYTSWSVVDGQGKALTGAIKTKAFAQEKLAELKLAGHTSARLKKRTDTEMFQVRIRRAIIGRTLTETFDTFKKADAWMRETEGEIAMRRYVDYSIADSKTLADLFDEYSSQLTSAVSSAEVDRKRMGKIRRHPIALIRLSALKNTDFHEYSKVRLNGGYVERLADGTLSEPWAPIKGSTLKKELELMTRVINHAVRRGGVHLPFNPCAADKVERPKKQEGDERKRRLQDFTPEDVQEKVAEIGAVRRKIRVRADVEYELSTEVGQFLGATKNEQQLMLRAARYPQWFRPRKKNITQATQMAREKANQKALVKARLRDRRRLWAILSFALETAMRRGEIVKLRWEDVHLDYKVGYVELPASITKNGSSRIIPLTLRARRILLTQPRASETVFSTNENIIKLAYRRLREITGLKDLRLHDLRHEATSRFFERTDLRAEEIGLVTGHKDRRMLMRYYNLRPHAFIDRFAESFRKKSE